MKDHIFHISSLSSPVSTVQSAALFLSAQARGRQALKAFFLFFALAILSVFIPVAHFILVPLFLFLSLFMSLQAKKRSHKIADLNFNCPECSKENRLASKVVTSEFKINCSHCRKQILIKIKGEV